VNRRLRVGTVGTDDAVLIVGEDLGPGSGPKKSSRGEERGGDTNHQVARSGVSRHAWTRGDVTCRLDGVDVRDTLWPSVAEEEEE
jgi:hypothetical protein